MNIPPFKCNVMPGILQPTDCDPGMLSSGFKIHDVISVNKQPRVGKNKKGGKVEHSEIPRKMAAVLVELRHR